MRKKAFEIVVLSGKGGTGKTTLTASLAYFAGKIVLSDCDVDAADLHLVMKARTLHTENIASGAKAVPDAEKCLGCGLCSEACRFDAIEMAGGKAKINAFACEGCGLCTLICPEKAIHVESFMKNRIVFASGTFGPLIYGEMGIGEENSGKLVSEVRKQAAREAEKQDCNLILVDGPPGIGCPVISSVTGTDMVIAVTEPSRSAWHDLDRLLKLTDSFKTRVLVVINKVDLNPEMTRRMENELKRRNIPVIGKLMYEEKIVDALMEGKSFPEAYPQHPLTGVLKDIWIRVREQIPA